jgi:hypothetical protein
MSAGPHEPLALASDCCDPGDATCIEEGTDPSLNCQAQLDGEQVTGLVRAVEDGGAAGLRLHTLNLLAGDDPEVEKGVRTSAEQMAFAARGQVHHVSHPDALRALAVGLLDVRTELVAKHLLVTNVHARATPKGPVPDSDADGLSDAEEEDAGTDPTLADSDGDHISDRIEILVGLDPLEADLPSACASVDPAADTDRDGLGDCDEVLIGTDPSLVDSDGDGMPDRVELHASTDYLHPDAASDPDADGITNGDEVRHHSDPRSTDALLHLSIGYRYDVDDEGRVQEAALPALKQITGVELVAVSPGSSQGLGELRFDPAGPSLSWRDAADPGPGPEVLLAGPGRFELGSSSYAPIQGDEGRYVAVRIQDPGALPPVAVQETVRVIFRDRHCLRYTVRNIRLMPTLAREGEEGWNQIILYFAEAPRGRLSKPGPYRLALVPVRFVPPAYREPNGAVLTVLDEEYVNPMLARLR